MQQEFLDHQMPVDATAAEILPIFESRGLTIEAIVAYTLLQLQRALEGRTVTVQRRRTRNASEAEERRR